MEDKKNKQGGPVQTSHEIDPLERDRLLREMNRPYMEKLRLFTRMLRRNALFKKAKVSHKHY
jgi:hypothetical protein